MLFGEFCGDPNDCHCLQARGICQQLTEVCVIGFLKLILDENPVSGFHVLAENIRPKRSNIALLGFEFEFEAYRVS